MLTRKSIKDIMVGIDEYPHIPSDISLKDAIGIVRSAMVDGKSCYQPMLALVFDKKGLVGTLRLRDILKGMEPTFLQPSSTVQGYSEDAAGLSVLWDTLFNKESRERVERPVSEVMNPVRVRVDVNDPIVKAAYLMIHNDLLVIPVLEEGKRVAGLIRMIEVFEELTKDFVENQETMES
ncbi:MAG: CBS domain-containing protein [Candidatus Aquicultor sp.]|nr:CBS domain-containing protein [Candidatus Aquicultor sp.]